MNDFADFDDIIIFSKDDDYYPETYEIDIKLLGDYLPISEYSNNENEKKILYDNNNSKKNIKIPFNKTIKLLDTNINEEEFYYNSKEKYEKFDKNFKKICEKKFPKLNEFPNFKNYNKKILKIYNESDSNNSVSNSVSNSYNDDEDEDLKSLGFSNDNYD